MWIQWSTASISGESEGGGAADLYERKVRREKETLLRQPHHPKRLQRPGAYCTMVSSRQKTVLSSSQSEKVPTKQADGKNPFLTCGLKPQKEEHAWAQSL